MVQVPGHEGNTLLDKVASRFRRKWLWLRSLRQKSRKQSVNRFILLLAGPARTPVAAGPTA